MEQCSFFILMNYYFFVWLRIRWTNPIAGIDLDAIKQFAAEFKKVRLSLGLTQTQVKFITFFLLHYYFQMFNIWLSSFLFFFICHWYFNIIMPGRKATSCSIADYKFVTLWTRLGWRCRMGGAGRSLTAGAWSSPNLPSVGSRSWRSPPYRYVDALFLNAWS